MTPAERFPVAGTGQGILESLKPYHARALFCTAFGSAMSILFSIAISQILLGIGLLLVVLGRPALYFPPIKLPFVLFFAATVLADLLSGDPLAGMPQIKKFYVFGIIVLVSSGFRSAARFTTLLVFWSAIAALSGAAGFVHILARRQMAVHLKWTTDYDYYLDDRIKGFANHWMTFGAEQMIVLLLLLSFLLFSCPRRWRILAGCCAAILWISLMLGLTRSIFLLGVPLGFLYLLCAFKPWTLALMPVLALASWAVMPFQVRERVWSTVSPHGEMDSNTFRTVTRRTGWEMVKDHPWLGLGPEQIRPAFESYVPPDIPRPLPPGWYGHLHNIYLQYAAERGIPALCFLLWMIGRMVVDFTRALRSGAVLQRHRYIVHGAIAVVVAVLAAGFFEYNLGDSEVLTMFLVVTTAAYATIRMDGEICS